MTSTTFSEADAKMEDRTCWWQWITVRIGNDYETHIAFCYEGGVRTSRAGFIATPCSLVHESDDPVFLRLYDARRPAALCDKCFNTWTKSQLSDVVA